MKATVIIERGSDGTFGAYIKESNIPYGIIGDGKTAEEAIQDFKSGYEDMRESYEQDGKEFPECEFTFKYDVPSFLQMYAYAFTLAGLSRITGIAQGQLSHYVTGNRTPSEKTVKKIESALHGFGSEIVNVRFV
jgi:predicted RNase H-like HicB family nuclease